MLSTNFSQNLTRSLDKILLVYPTLFSLLSITDHAKSCNLCCLVFSCTSNKFSTNSHQWVKVHLNHGAMTQKEKVQTKWEQSTAPRMSFPHCHDESLTLILQEEEAPHSEELSSEGKGTARWTTICSSRLLENWVPRPESPTTKWK